MNNNSKLHEQLSLFLGAGCNNNCIFCVASDRKEKNLSTQEVIEIMKRGRKNNIKNIVISGGECTTRNDLLTLIETAKKLGYQHVQIQTNGKKLSQKKYAQSIISSGVDSFAISLHGHIPELNDMLTRTQGSFWDVIDGITNVLNYKNDSIILTNTVITTINYQYLKDIVKLLSALKVNVIQLAFIHGLGRAKQNFDRLVPYVKDVKRFVIEAIEFSLSQGYGIGSIMVEAFPYCLMKGYEEFSSDLFIPKTTIMNTDGTLGLWNLENSRAKGPNCSICTYNRICHGPWREYPEKRGWNEFVPILKNISKDILRYKIMK